ncbi:MAG: hypothetical protein K0U78_16310 [Actinomycetia bacterium]|nr:hypothetical protein [Actinomycetes bacterium]
MSTFPRPLLVSQRGNPELEALLREMEDDWRSAGIDLSVITPAEVTRLPKAKAGTHAIPPRELWPNMVGTIRDVFMPIRAALGVPVSARGYRPPDYNEAVGGSPGSRHQDFSALDLRSEKPRDMALAAAKIFAERGVQLDMGFGAYGYPRPSNIHVDTGWRRRRWRDAKKYLDDVGNV